MCTISILKWNKLHFLARGFAPYQDFYVLLQNSNDYDWRWPRQVVWENFWSKKQRVLSAGNMHGQSSLLKHQFQVHELVTSYQLLVQVQLLSPGNMQRQSALFFSPGNMHLYQTKHQRKHKHQHKSKHCRYCLHCLPKVLKIILLLNILFMQFD